MASRRLAVISLALLILVFLGFSVDASGFSRELLRLERGTDTEGDRGSVRTGFAEFRGSEFILKSSLTEPSLTRMLEADRLQVVRSLLLPGHYLVEAVGDPDYGMLSRLHTRSYVDFLEPNYVRHLDFVPNDSLYSYQWHLHQVQSEDAWDRSTGTGITIAVLDTGVAYEDYDVYYQAPDLAGTAFAPGYDFYNDDAHPNDDDAHGTHVAGTIAQATDNGMGVAGLAFDATIMPVKVCGPGEDGCPLSSIIDGIVFATDNGARVISMSLGGPDHSQSELNAVRYAYDQDVVVVAAAGNDDSTEQQYPAAFDEVIAVGASEYRRRKAPYSNYGSWIDFVAPGGDNTADRNDDGYRDGVLQQTLSDADSGDYSDFGYWFYQGTSMATPHVSALSALLLSVDPGMSPAEVYGLIRDSALDLGDAGKDDVFGWGLIQASDALDLALAPTGTPDLILQDFWIEPANPAEGDNVSIYAVIENIGGADAGNFTLGVFLDGDMVASGEFTLEASAEITTEVSWVAEVGNHTVEWVVDLYDDVAELNEDNNEAALEIEVVPERRIIIGASSVSDARASVGTNQTIGFRAFWEDGVTPVTEGLIFVNGTGYAPDGDGWVWLEDSSDVVVRKTWVVTGVDVDNVTVFQMQTSDPSIVWDRIRVLSISVSDGRADVESTQQVFVRTMYEYDGVALTQGLVFLNGEAMSLDPEKARWIVNVTDDVVERVTYQVTDVIDELYDLTVIRSVNASEIVWDRLEVYDAGATDDRVDVGTFVTVWFKARWVYDGAEFGSGQQIFVNEASASWSSSRERWERVFSDSAVKAKTFQVTGHTDNVFNISARTDLVDPQMVVWDAIECYSLDLDDERVDVGSNIEFRARCCLASDQHELGSMDSLSTDFGNLTWDSEESRFEIARTQEEVGNYTFRVVSGYEATYGIGVVIPVVEDPVGVWDRIEVYYAAIDNDRVDVGTYIQMMVRARLQYDGHPLGGEDSVEGSLGALSWNGSASWFEGRRRQSDVGSHTFTVDAASESTYGITVVHMAVSEPVGIWDRIIVDLIANRTRVDVGSAPPINISAIYAYDGAPLQGEVSLDRGLVQDDVGLYTYMASSVRDDLYGLEGFESDAVDIVFDRVEISLSVADGRIDVGSGAQISWTGTYSYDGELFLGEVALNSSVIKQTVGVYGFRAQSITDSRFGLTVFVSNAVQVIFDRVDVTLTVSDGRIDVGDTASIQIHAEYDFDDTRFSGDVVLNRPLSQEEVGVGIFWASEIHDAIHGLTAVSSNRVEVVWDRIQVTLRVEDARVDVASTAVVEWAGIYEYDGTGFGGTVYLDRDLMQSEVGRYDYTVQSVDDPLYGITVFVSNEVEVIFDRVQFTLQVGDDRIDIGSEAEIEWSGRYEYDGASYAGEVQLNHELSQSAVGEYSYMVESITDDVYGLTVFVTDTVDVIFDEVVVELRGSERTEVGDEADITWTATYAFDGAVFRGEVSLSESLVQSGMGPVSYSAASVQDPLYELSSFQSNTVQVVFDEMGFRVRVDTLVPGRVVVEVTVFFEWDGARIEDALAEVSGVEADPRGEGVYSAVLENYGVTADPTVTVSRPRFSSSSEDTSNLAIGNILLYVSLLGALVVFVLLFHRMWAA